MIIARRSATALGTDPVAGNLRSFVTCSARLQSRPQSAPTVAPAVAANLDLAALYPAIFAGAPQRAPGVSIRGAKPALISAAGAAMAVVVAAFHR